MLIEGDTSVIDVIKTKKKLQDMGEDVSHINILCIVDGGLMKGAYATGAGIALEELGYTNVFNTVVGISSGAPAAAYFVAGEVWKGSSLIHDECCQKDFMNWKRFWSPLNANLIIDAMRSGRKKLTWENIKESSAKLLIGVTRHDDATPQLIQSEDSEKLLNSINASISVPGLTNKKVMLDDVFFTDGGFAEPHILEHSLNTIGFTHAIVFTSQDKETPDVPLLEKILNHTLLRGRYSKKLLKAANARRKARFTFIESKLKENGPICFIWGDNSIASKERNSDTVKRVVHNWYQKWLKLLE